MAYKLIFLDTETTGNEAKDFLCQVAYSINGKRTTALYKPPIPIPPAASAVHHITNKMVAGKPEFKFSLEFKELHDLLHDNGNIMVAHNAPFDIGMLKKEGIIPERYIDTLRVARYLDPDEKLESYRLQFLRYALDLEVETGAVAHDALGDVIVLEKLFERLHKKLTDMSGGDEKKAIEEMMEISGRPSLIKVFRFGKYKDQRIEDVAMKDKGYLQWLLSQKMENPEDEEDWIFTLKHFLGK